VDTRVWDVSIAGQEADRLISEAAAVLAAGGLVAFPTETVYGLGASALNAAAAQRVYEVKGRPSDNPMIVHIAALSQVFAVAEADGPLEGTVRSLAGQFWPGPLTLILPKKDCIPAVVTGGLNTVAVRMPDNAVALALLRGARVPVAAPSANLSGQPSPTKGEHVVRDLDGKVDGILVADESRVGIESTVLDLTVIPPVILRPGVVTPALLTQALGIPVRVAGQPSAGADAAPKSPGMKYRHYAPRAEVRLFEGAPADTAREAARVMAAEEAAGRKVGLLLFGDMRPEEAAHALYAELRRMDEEGMDLILATGTPESDGVGLAVMNRLRKSAGGKSIKV
jgi:L-threonylcarbamoyladenylate synthase